MLPNNEDNDTRRHRALAEDAADFDMQPYPGLFSHDTMPAIIESLVIDDVVSNHESQHSQGEAGTSTSGTCGHRRQRSSRSSQSRIMTSEEFEMYRKSRMMHSDELDSESGDSLDEEDSHEVDERKLKEEAALERQRKEAYIAEQRLTRRKISGGEVNRTPHVQPPDTPPDAVDASVNSWLSMSEPILPGLDTPGTKATAAREDDDDEDVPIALLAANRAPTADRRVRREGSPQNNMHSSTRPHFRSASRQLTTPSPQPHAHLRPFTPSPSPTAMGHRYGRSTGMANASQLSLPASPQVRRPHTSGGLVNQIGLLESPGPRNKRREDLEPNPWVFAAKPRQFYGRERPEPMQQMQQYPVMMGGQQMYQIPQQLQGGMYYGATPMGWGQSSQYGQPVAMYGQRMY